MRNLIRKILAESQITDFKVGDLVIVNGEYHLGVPPNHLFKDNFGEIVGIFGHEMLIAFENWNAGHDSYRQTDFIKSKCGKNNCWYFPIKNSVYDSFVGTIEPQPEVDLDWDRLYEGEEDDFDWIEDLAQFPEESLKGLSIAVTGLPFYDPHGGKRWTGKFTRNIKGWEGRYLITAVTKLGNIPCVVVRLSDHYPDIYIPIDSIDYQKYL